MVRIYCNPQKQAEFIECMHGVKRGCEQKAFLQNIDYNEYKIHQQELFVQDPIPQPDK